MTPVTSFSAEVLSRTRDAHAHTRAAAIPKGDGASRQRAACREDAAK